MVKIKSALAVLAVAAASLALPGVANASVYTTSYMTREFDRQNPNTLEQESATVYFQVFSTYTSRQIWINGRVTCDGSPVAHITWCGVGGGNGTATLNVGLNWDVPDWGAYGLYERMNLHANGARCDTWGSNDPVGQIDNWANDTLVCGSRA